MPFHHYTTRMAVPWSFKCKSIPICAKGKYQIRAFSEEPPVPNSTLFCLSRDTCKSNLKYVLNTTDKQIRFETQKESWKTGAEQNPVLFLTTGQAHTWGPERRRLLFEVRDVAVPGAESTADDNLLQRRPGGPPGAGGGEMGGGGQGDCSCRAGLPEPQPASGCWAQPPRSPVCRAWVGPASHTVPRRRRGSHTLRSAGVWGWDPLLGSRGNPLPRAFSLLLASRVGFFIPVGPFQQLFPSWFCAGSSLCVWFRGRLSHILSRIFCFDSQRVRGWGCAGLGAALPTVCSGQASPNPSFAEHTAAHC